MLPGAMEVIHSRGASEENALAEADARADAIPGPCDEIPASLRELALQIFAKRDPVAVGVSLLDAESESVKARAFADIASWAYQAPSPAETPDENPPKPRVRIICDIPRPPYEKSSND